MHSEITEFLIELEEVTMNGTEQEYLDLLGTVTLEQAVTLQSFGEAICQLFEVVALERLTGHPEQFEGHSEESE